MKTFTEHKTEHSENIYFIFSKKASSTGPATPGGAGGALAPSLFGVAKRKNGNKGEKRFSKHKLLKVDHQG